MSSNLWFVNNILICASECFSLSSTAGSKLWGLYYGILTFLLKSKCFRMSVSFSPSESEASFYNFSCLLEINLNKSWLVPNLTISLCWSLFFEFASSLQSLMKHPFRAPLSIKYAFLKSSDISTMACLELTEISGICKIKLGFLPTTVDLWTNGILLLFYKFINKNSGSLNMFERASFWGLLLGTKTSPWNLES